MYVAPNTTIKLLKGCPLDPSYENTIYFASASAQQAYFSGLSGYTFNNNTYQRANKGSLRVAMNAESLYDCNYLMFQNASFGTKWFYAFVTAIDYINDVTSEIKYEIDVLQTWHFDYLLRQCFIERTHTLTDDPGGNLVPENLELGEYVIDDFFVSGELRPYSIVVACSFDSNYDPSAGNIYSGIYSGLTFHVFSNDVTGANACIAFINGAVADGKADGIVSIFLMASSMVAAGGSVSPNTEDYAVTKKISAAIDGYIPRNKKLYTYPYNFLYATNMQGSAAAFPYEYFSTTTCGFRFIGDMSPNPSVVMVPLNYKGESVNFDEKMVLSGYPQVAYNIDAFKAWLAQNATSLAVNAASTAVTAAVNPVAGVLGAASLVAQVYEHSIMPQQTRGGAGAATNCALGFQEFAFAHKHIRAEFLAIIDDYFDLYGYAVHRVGIPGRDIRPEWTYVKTVGCKIDPKTTSGLPADDMAKIESLYNAGIRWWKTPAHIGNYSYSNAPVTPATS